jgi:hypothetical protein
MDSKLTAGLIIVLVKSFLVYLKLFYKGKVEKEVLAEVLREKQDEYERVRKVLEKVDDPRSESIDDLRSELLKRSKQR